MSSDNPAFPKELLSPLGNSGFPFQTAVVAAIRSVGHVVIEEEIAWWDGDGSHRFLDIVASIGHVQICIECKAMRNERFVFLLPRPVRAQTADLYVLHLGRVQDSRRRPIVKHGICQAAPITTESMYCVALGKKSEGKKSEDGRLIEKEAQPLVRGTEQYAKDQSQQFRSDNNRIENVICIPVLVTTAHLFVAEYNPLDISLKDGIYKAREENIQPARFVRFTKEFTAHGSKRSRLRTVIVTQAKHLQELVSDLSTYVPANKESSVIIYDPTIG